MLDLNTNENLIEENNITEPDVIYNLEKAVKIGRLPLHSTTRW